MSASLSRSSSTRSSFKAGGGGSPVLPLYTNHPPSSSTSAHRSSISVLGGLGLAGGGTRGQPGPSQITLTRKRRPPRHSHHRRSASSPFNSFGASALLAPASWPSLLLSIPRHYLSPAYLTQRARTTNLAVLLLLLTLAASVMGNLRWYLHEHPLSGERDRLPLSIRATLPHSNILLPAHQPAGAVMASKGQHGPSDAPASTQQAQQHALPGSPGSAVNLANLDHLILVPGHAVWKGRSSWHVWHDDNWILEPVQKGGSVRTFIKHVLKGVDEALSDPSSLLIFSGGQTRPYAYETEADSYFRLAQTLNLYNLLAPSSDGDRRSWESVGRDLERSLTNGRGLNGLLPSKAYHAKRAAVADAPLQADLASPSLSSTVREDEGLWKREAAQEDLEDHHVSLQSKAAQEAERIANSPAGENTKEDDTTFDFQSRLSLDGELDLPPFPRATTEQFALDSFQNLVFSICRFKEITGHYPTKITVVGFGMKRSRFTDLHRRALRWPERHFRYIGIDDEGETGQSYLGELTNGLQPYTQDLYGCKAPLITKRRARNPFRRIHPYFTSNPQLKGLLEFCPADGTEVWSGRLPWDDGGHFLAGKVGLMGDH